MVLFGIIEKNIRAFKINSQIFYIMNIITEYQQKNSVFPLIVLFTISLWEKVSIYISYDKLLKM